MNTLTLIQRSTLHIKCPLCNGQQKFEMSVSEQGEHIWYCVPPFCCDIMRNSDTEEWNELIDHLIIKALLK